MAAVVLVAGLTSWAPAAARDDAPDPDLTAGQVEDAVRLGRRYLLRRQLSTGGFPSDGFLTHSVGVTCIATVALLDSGLTAQDEPIRRSLDFLRALPPEEPSSLREAALLIVTLAAADEPADRPRVDGLCRRLENEQRETGGWAFSATEPPDESLSQLALIALRAAALRKTPVAPETWRRAARYWRTIQAADGGWDDGKPSAWVDAYGLPDEAGRMRAAIGRTLAGVAALSICGEMLATAEATNGDGTLDCCRSPQVDPALRRGVRWLEAQRAGALSDGTAKTAAAFFLYGLDRSRRQTDHGLLGGRDWYRPAATALLLKQDRARGSWKGNNDVIATSHAVSFLSTGLAPVLVSKLRYGLQGDDAIRSEDLIEDWNRHPNDAAELVEMIRGRPGWPRLLMAQEVDLGRGSPREIDERLALSPVLLMTGSTAPILPSTEIARLGEYVQNGGVLFAVASCPGGTFDSGFRELVPRIVPGAELVPLTRDHPIYRSEFILERNDEVLWGVDAGCRTAVVYCPEDLACHWAAATQDETNGRGSEARTPRRRALEIGANVVAFAAGREPPNRLDAMRLANERERRAVRQGGPRIAQLRHDGGWDVASRALGNLCFAVTETAGVSLAAEGDGVSCADPRLFRYPLLFLHGKRGFSPSDEDCRGLREHLDRGGVLIANACCGSPEFDAAFRSFATELYPRHPLVAIPPGHEMFSAGIGHQIDHVATRNAGADEPISQEPEIEGIEVEGRYVVLYSRRDLSCALDRRPDPGCDGYVREDAVRIAVNLVLYALLQEVNSTETDSP